MHPQEIQVTRNRREHVLTNIGAWSPDSQWLAYDIRSNSGENFDGSRIEMVNVVSGEVKTLYECKNGARCGVVTFNPRSPKVVFILGPENPTPDWQYGFYHRDGVIVDVAKPGAVIHLDGRDVTPPFTPGALRGGSHVHVWDPAGEWVSYTYEDHVLATFKDETAEHEINLRNVGVAVPHAPVTVKKDHPRNQDGQYFNVLVTRTTANPTPGSDEIKRAFEEGWVGTNGYVRADGSRQKHALAFQGQVVSTKGETVSEVFIVDLPDDMTVPGDGPLEGTSTRRPLPPRGAVQRRLTFTTDRKNPGIQGTRHWLRSSPDGSRIALLMKDDAGVVQLWTVSPRGGAPAQITRNQWPIASTFTWSPDGRLLAHAMDNSICVTELDSGRTTRLTPRSDDATAPRPLACVFSPDGRKIAYQRIIGTGSDAFHQLFFVQVQ